MNFIPSGINELQLVIAGFVIELLEDDHNPRQSASSKDLSGVKVVFSLLGNGSVSKLAASFEWYLNNQGYGCSFVFEIDSGTVFVLLGDDDNPIRVLLDRGELYAMLFKFMHKNEVSDLAQKEANRIPIECLLSGLCE